MHAGRRVVVGIVAAAAGLGVLGVVLRRGSAERSVVLVTLDTVRADRTGVLGRSPSITPEIDALAARGVAFERAWTVAPLTVPAHATMLTGLLPPQHGLRLNRPSAPLPAPGQRRFTTLAEAMREGGHRTAAFVSASVLRADDTGLGAGFDVYDEVPRAQPGSLHDSERRGEETVDAALAWIRRGDGPAFLWVHLFDPHAPYDAPVGWGAGPAHVADATGYDAEVRYADHCVGRLLRGLEEAGLGDAAVCVVADHGEGLGEHGEAAHGHLLHEATVRVPLVVAAPGLPRGERRAEPVSVADVFPTLLALAGRGVPSHAMGRPLFPGPRPGDPVRPLYAETLYPWHACRWAQTFALLRGDSKIVVSGPRTWTFDLAADPGEESPRPAGAAERPSVEQLLDVAGRPPLGTLTPGAPAEQAGPYWSTGSEGASPVLPAAENAALPSPYDRMGVLAALDRARSLLASGRGAEALAAFEGVVAEDPPNPQARFWRARALEALHRDVEAAQGYRAAYEAGFRTADCVSKALQCSLKAIERGRDDERTTATAFLASARGRGTPDNAATLLWEAYLCLAGGDADAADRALERSESAPGADRVRAGIDEARELLRTLRGGK